MKIYIMRHGEASYYAQNDAERELTAYGVEQCQQDAQWLKQQAIAIDLALVSPYVRARQSLQVVSDILAIPEFEVHDALTPAGNVQIMADYLLTLGEHNINSVLVVSHLPLVSDLVSELCTDKFAPMFATAAIAHVTLPADGAGQLQWMHSSN